MRRPRRADAVVDYDKLLYALASVRHDLTSSMARMPIDGSLYEASARLLDGIDELALLLTGRPEALHAPAHGRR